MHERTHASFFSGVGGLDLGLERAGWRTVSFSEIDPYASAVLAERWPGVPNVGSITAPELHEPRGGPLSQYRGTDDWTRAALWTGGFPCQDLSVAGKRRGMVEGTRSALAFAFLDLVERHRPPAVLLENVPGLLSSHRGRDMAVLLGRMAELGYGVAYRLLDARHFGVPQRRRRVFILGLRSDLDDPSGRVAAERAAEVLSVGSRCRRHPPTGVEAGPGATAGTPERFDGVGTIDGSFGHHGGANPLQNAYAGHYLANGLRAPDGHHGYGSPRGDGGDNLVSASPDPRGVRAADGLAGGLDDRDGVVDTLNSGGNNGGFRTEPGAHLVAIQDGRAIEKAQNGRGWNDDGSAYTVDGTGAQAIAGINAMTAYSRGDYDPLLPLGLDSNRYRCCGNGVVAPVAEWIGARLAGAVQ